MQRILQIINVSFFYLSVAAFSTEVHGGGGLGIFLTSPYSSKNFSSIMFCRYNATVATMAYMELDVLYSIIFYNILENAGHFICICLYTEYK